MQEIFLTPMTDELFHQYYKDYQNDSVKGQGIGTIAEQLILDYATDQLGMKTVYADSILKNTRSQRVLEKVGFALIGIDDTFKYYKFEKK